MSSSLRDLFYESMCIATEILSMLGVYAVQICLNIYLSFHLCQMFALSFFNFFPCKASFPGSMTLCLFLAFSQKSQSVNVRVVGNFPVKRFFVLLFIENYFLSKTRDNSPAEGICFSSPHTCFRLV